jgi:hypothetical protein
MKTYNNEVVQIVNKNNIFSLLVGVENMNLGIYQRLLFTHGGCIHV